MAARGTIYKYSMRTATGLSSKMDGPIRSPEHAGVVTAALAGYLSDDVGLLKAAPDLLASLGNLLALIDANAGRITGGEVEFGEARSAIAKAEGLS